MTPRLLISTFVDVCEVIIKNLSQDKGAAKVDAWSKINSIFTYYLYIFQDLVY